MKALLGFVVLAVLSLVGPAAAASLKAPRASSFETSEVRGENFPRTAARVIPAAQRGDARAQAQLGFMHAYGRGVPQNYGVAIYWYVRSAEQGNPTGQHLLGLAYDKGHGVLTDHIEAHKWLNLAAAGTSGAEHEDNVRLRDAVANKLTKDQLAEAMYRARVWVPKRER